MKVSVIIPTFNRAGVLSRAIDSVLAQSWKEFELIVVDDGSTDETKELLEGYGDSLVVLKQQNKGVSAARNLGMSRAEGEWIALLDSDDEWLPHRLQKQMDFVRDNPHIRLVHGEEIWVRRGKRVNQKKRHRKSGGDIFVRSLELCLVSPSASLIRKDLLKEWGGFDEDFEVCEDYDLWLKVSSKEEVGFIEEPIIVKHGGHEDQLSAKYFAMDYWRVWSMIRLHETADLPKDKRDALFDQVRKKCDVLIAGYLKHNNLENLEQVRKWHEQVNC